MQFNDALLACHVIHSGMVSHADNTSWDKVGSGLSKISSHIPIGGLVVAVLGGICHAMPYKDKKMVVNRGAEFLIGGAKVEQIGEALVRQLCLSLVDPLSKIKSPGFFQKHYQDLKNALLVNNIDTDIR